MPPLRCPSDTSVMMPQGAWTHVWNSEEKSAGEALTSGESCRHREGKAGWSEDEDVEDDGGARRMREKPE